MTHTFRWKQNGRMGQQCKVLQWRGYEVLVEFEDGTKMIVARLSLRLIKRELVHG